MTGIQFLSTLKKDDNLRRSASRTIAPDLFHYIRSPVQSEPDHIQAAFIRDIEEAIFLSQNALDSLVYLRSKGWAHGTDMHQVMENAYRQLQDVLEDVFGERCRALGYIGPLLSPSVVTVSGKDHVAIQVDELVPECCFMAVPLLEGRLRRDDTGTLHPSKKNWLAIEAVIREYDDKDGIKEIRRDFSKYWRKTDFGDGPYHREFLTMFMRDLGL